LSVFANNSASDVRREKALVHSGKVPPQNWFAPHGSNRSSGGGDEATETSGVESRFRRLGSMQAVMKVNAEQALKRITQELIRR